MAGTQEVIREYLVQLGFQVNKSEQQDFTKTIKENDKLVATFSKTILGAIVAVGAMAAKFASSMDQLYYSSQKASSSAANLKAFEYAGRQIGLTSEAVDGMVQNLAMTLRTDPGMKGWVESLGVNASEARQGVDIWMDLLTKLHDKPFYEGVQFAQMIGMSPDQFFQIETNLDQFRGKVQDRLGMAKTAGLDQDAAALRGRDLANEAGRIAEQSGIGLDKLGEAAAPTLSTAADKLSHAGDLLIRGATGQLTPEEKAREIEHPSWARPRDESKGPAKSLLGDQPQWMTDLENRFKSRGALGQGKTQADDTMDFLERTFNLPKGELDHLWKNESNRGDPRFMRSNKGALGHFGLMPGTAKEMGVDDPMDFNQSAAGAAKYLAKLRDKYGNIEDAEHAYNWGPGNMDRYLGAKAQGKNPTMPKETQNYTKGSPINVTVNESKTPMATANAVVQKIHRALGVTAADEQRYLTGNTR
jgi:transglycosylase-like protein with SLT domain